MDKEFIRKIAKKPQYIPGIYNYCDRWCERCSFTSQCMNFEISEKEFIDPAARDINNKAFWDKLHEISTVTLEMVLEKATEMGINLDEIDCDEIRIEEDKIYGMAEQQPYSIIAMEYIRKVDSWFRENKDQFKTKGDDFLSHIQADIPGTNPDNDIVEINDCLEVINWYKHQIYVKLIRAASSFLQSNPNEIECSTNDANGSAKVALIGIERSIAAWAGLLPHLPELEGGILDLLVILKRLITLVESAFPNARFFLRPGFDVEKTD